MDNILQQLQYFLASFLCGVLLFFLYDFLRIFRKLLPHHIGMKLLEDLMFGLGASVIMFQMVFELNNGTLRFFSFIAFGGGVYSYYLLAGNRFSSWVAKILHNILWPIGRMAKKVGKNVKNCLKKCYKHIIIKSRD